MSKAIIRYKDREEWLAARGQGIGASEVGTVLGLNPFETPYQLWRRKRGMDAPKEENFAMRAGHYLEDAVSRFYADATGCTIIKNTVEDFTVINREKPFLRVSPDRLYWPQGARHNEAGKAVLECKTTQLDVDADNLPQHWFCQLQMNMGVCECRRGALAWLTRGREFGCKDIEFDAEFFAWMSAEVERFWRDNVLGGEEPPAYTAADVQLKYPAATEGKEVEADARIETICRELKEVKAETAELEKRKREIEDAVKMAMGDAERLVSPADGGTPATLATWRTSKGQLRFNEKRFASEHPVLYASYLTQSPGSRRFIVK